MTVAQGTLLTLVGIVFGAGTAYGLIQGKIEKIRTDANNIGRLMRENERRAERRWKHMIATAIETSADLEEAKFHARLLREDAWRD